MFWPESKLPGELRVCTAFNERGYHASCVIHEFQMAILHKVLSRNAGRQVLTPAPGKSRIHFRVSGNFSISQTVYKIGGSIPSDSMHEVEMGSKLGAVIRAASFGTEHRHGVLARRVQVHVNLFEGIPGAQCPTGGCFPVRCDLEPMCFSVHEVLVG